MENKELIKRLKAIQDTASEIDAWYIASMIEELIDDVEGSKS